MPNNFDFDKIDNIKTIEIHPKGWISPLYVEYGIVDDETTRDIPSYCWRVKGTQHTFIIPVMRMDFLSAGDYAKHFVESLETFRDDYLEWKDAGFYTKWMQEYEKQYKYYIIL